MPDPIPPVVAPPTPPTPPVAPPVAPPAPPPAAPPVAPPTLLATPPATPAPDPTKPPVTPPAKVVPETYDLKLPQGSLLDASVIEKTAAFAKENGLSNEAAQAILDRENSDVAAYVDAQKAQVAQQQDAWIKESQTDKEFGGEKFAENAELAKRAVERFGSDAFKKALNETKLGNHPELLRVFVRIGKAMADDKFLPPGAMTQGKKSPAEILYGPDNPQPPQGE